MKHAIVLVSILCWMSSVEAQLSTNDKQPANISRKPSSSVQREAWGSAAWHLVTSEAAFSPRDTTEDLVFAGKMWLSNGYYHGNKLTRDLWCSTDGAVWRRILEHTPYDGYSELVVFDDKMWAIKQNVWNSTDGKRWTRVAEHTPFGTRGYGEALVHHKDFTTHNDVWCSADGTHWTRVPEHAPWTPRQWFIAKVYRNRLWIIGGYDNVNSGNLGDV